MARPKRPFSGEETIRAARVQWMGLQLGVRQAVRWDASSRWTLRTPSSQFEPLTLLYVLDAVANMDPDIELRALRLSDYLNLQRSQLIWNPVTVGMALADLCFNFEDVLGAGNGILEAGRDYRGAFYRIHHTKEVARLYESVREELMRMVGIEILEQASRQKKSRPVSPLIEIPAFRGEWKAL